MKTKKIDATFESFCFSSDENEMIDKKMSRWNKKEFVQAIYELGNMLDEQNGGNEVTKALQNFDSALITLRIWNEKNNNAGKCLDQWKTYRKNLLIYYFQMQMKEEGTVYLKENKGKQLSDFSMDYAEKVFEKARENFGININVSDPEGYIERIRYRVKKPKQPSGYYESVGAVPCSDKHSGESGLELLDDASLKNLLKIMIEAPEGLQWYLVNIQRITATASSHNKEKLYSVSKESLGAVKKQCADRIEEIHQLKKKCEKLEKIITDKRNKPIAHLAEGGK